MGMKMEYLKKKKKYLQRSQGAFFNFRKNNKKKVQKDYFDRSEK